MLTLLRALRPLPKQHDAAERVGLVVLGLPILLLPVTDLCLLGQHLLSTPLLT